MNEAYVCAALRTPFGRYGGALAMLRTDDLAAAPLAELKRRYPQLDWAAVDEVWLGCANQAGEDNRNVARMAVLLAGLPETVPGTTVNRLCGSGLDAIGSAARAIKAGEMHLAIAGGVESMSRAPFVMPKAEAAFARTNAIYDTTIGWRFINPAMKAAYGVDSMPETGENVAAQFNVSRADQDAFALRSQQRYAQAQARGFFAAERFALTLPAKKGEALVVAADEHPRETSLAALGQLKGVVKADGTVTAGNASGVNDGAGALLLASDAALKRPNAVAAGLKPLARIGAMATAGVAPRIMGMGPHPAVEKLLALTDWKLGTVDVIELNEAFASQALAVLRQLKIADDDPRVNANGGAIAIGHPLGASGARLVATAIHQLHATGGKRAIATMCVGVGQGIAVALERV